MRSRDAVLIDIGDSPSIVVVKSRAG